MNTKPPYIITSMMLRLIEEIGMLEASVLQQGQLRLRKESVVRTIHSSLTIEGNTLSMENSGCVF